MRVNYAPTKVGGLWGVALVLKIHDHIPQLIQIQQTLLIDSPSDIFNP